MAAIERIITWNFVFWWCSD